MSHYQQWTCDCGAYVVIETTDPQEVVGVECPDCGNPMERNP